MKTFSQGASFIHISQYPGALLSKEEKEPQRALAYHSCSPGATPFAVGIVFFVPKSFCLSNMVILSLKKTSFQRDDSIWKHFFTFRKASTLSQNALPFNGSCILGRSFSLHSVFRFVSHLTIFARESRESYSLQFLYVYVFSLLPILVFS